MVEAWTFAGSPSVSGLAGGTATLVDGTSFCISSPAGDIDAGSSQGLFYRDTRYLSGWHLRVNGSVPQVLSTITHDPFSATFLARVAPSDGQADSGLLILRHRFVGDGMREDLVIRNQTQQPAACVMTMAVDADFAHIFDVKEGRVSPPAGLRVESSDSSLTFSRTWPDRSRDLEVRSTGRADAARRLMTFEATVPPKGEWRACMDLRLRMDGIAVVPQYRCGEPVEESVPAARFRAWTQRAPQVVRGSQELRRALAQGREDLGALRIFAPGNPDRAVIAAGAPWFMTLFGRDSLITSWMALPVDPSLAVGTLIALARYQGERVDAATAEEPGRILHEMRWGMRAGEGRQAGDLYYGTADATPLFVMLLGELRRWGLEDELLTALLPHADRALEWVATYGDRDGDGFVEYERSTAQGLVNQGWKDSWDGVNFADGHLAEAPIALCEVQAYVYAAYRARAQLAMEMGDTVTARRYDGKAERLKTAFNRAFWVADGGYFAIGLDGDKRPIDALTSNIGHCLWTGVVDRDKAARIAAHLVSSALFTGWGVRTLATSMGAYNPVSYHNGSVWPHDTAIAAAGLMRYGYTVEAQTIALGLLHAAEAFDGRLPELFCGFDRTDFAVPVSYPTSCSPQAWAAATPFSLLRTLLRFDPSMPSRKLWLDPAIPLPLGDLRVENIALDGSRLTIDVTGGETSVAGLPPHVQLVRQTRHPLRNPI